MENLYSLSSLIKTLLVLSVALTGCASKPTHKLARKTSPIMKVFVSPTNLTQIEYQSIVTGLMRSGRFLIVDRSEALSAGENEKNYQDSAEMGYKLTKRAKIEGAGGVIVASQACTKVIGFTEVYRVCNQNLSLYDISSSRLIYADEGEFEGQSVNWKRTTKAFASNIPVGIVDEEIPMHMLEDIAAEEEAKLAGKD